MDFPIENGDLNHSYVKLPEGKSWGNDGKHQWEAGQNHRKTIQEFRQDLTELDSERCWEAHQPQVGDIPASHLSMTGGHYPLVI